ncbi:MAG: tetratricopeptide repeat protein [Proteobacteria bacterium]|nr:tetratricopeptide repeat protein [Pseudomonadota bacterium]
MFPGIGCALYYITQFGPDAANSQVARNARKRPIGVVDPKRELRKRMDLLEIANAVENRIALAEECYEAGLYEDAIPLLKKSLSALNESDPQTMALLAKCHYGNGDPQAAAETLKALIKENPDHKSPDDHLLFARSLEAMGNDDDACKEYDVLCRTFPGEEARVRYGLLLSIELRVLLFRYKSNFLPLKARINRPGG